MDIKSLIIGEYLNGNISLTALERKHRVSRRVLTKWIKAQIGFIPKGVISMENIRGFDMKKSIDPSLPDDVITLKKQLEQERLRNQLLNAMIDIAEKELKIPIRKKSGTRQSSK